MPADNTGLTGQTQAAVADLDETRSSQARLVDKYERLYRSYRGILDGEMRHKALEWTHKLTPRHVGHIIETSIASLMDERLRFRVRPRPRMFEPGEFERAKHGSDALQILLDHQLAADRFSEKQRPFALQNAIAGLTAAKVYWRQSSRMKPRVVNEPRLVIDPLTGVPLGTVPFYLEGPAEPDILYDGPCVEVVKITDLFWDFGATDIDDSRFVGHRTWPTVDELKRKACKKNGGKPHSGPCEGGIYHNLEKLSDTGDFGNDRSDWGLNDDVSPAEKTKGRAELVEIWRKEPDGIRVYTVANRTVSLDASMDGRANPYWHGQYPFVVCATQSDLFRIEGQSMVEQLAPLQEALWTVSNTRLDNMMYVNQGSIFVNEDLVDDPESIKLAPGQLNMFRGGSLKDAVEMWAPNPLSAQISIPAENMLLAQMQNMSGSMPFTSTSEARGVGANTATEAALVSSMAQRSVSHQKIQLNYAYERMGQMMLELNQQFVRDAVYVEVIGLDSEYELREILPEMLQGSYRFDIGPMNESLMRQEKRSEQQMLFQTLVNAFQPLALSGAPINLKAAAEDLLESFDKHDLERYFVSQPPTAAPGQSGGPAAPPGAGQTNPGLAAGPQSPSSQLSMSPEVFAQRANAGPGGPGI